ncbi:MAG: hypothetical protein M3003_10530 [Candidatus Dormibacteraeota bacterium]|nr:hypothetical protein [Candidatus Dormibacteraeota bacterium]
MSITGHLVCVRCHPGLDGPAVCGATEPVVGVCEACHALTFAPCQYCQTALWGLWTRGRTVDA